MPRETPFDGLECLKPVWAEIAAPNRGQYHCRHHRHAADPDNDGKDMQRARDGEIVHATPPARGSGRIRLRRKAGRPRKPQAVGKTSIRRQKVGQRVAIENLQERAASPREARAAARSIPRSGKTRIRTRHPITARSSSVSRTTAPTRICAGGRASLIPPFRPRTVSTYPCTPRRFTIFIR